MVQFLKRGRSLRKQEQGEGMTNSPTGRPSNGAPMSRLIRETGCRDGPPSGDRHNAKKICNSYSMTHDAMKLVSLR